MLLSLTIRSFKSAKIIWKNIITFAIKRIAMQKTKPEATFKWTSTFNQYYATVVANLIIFAQGSASGWTSPALQQLTSDDTPLSSGPFTNEEVSWIGSTICIGAIFGSISVGYLISIMGCKRALYVWAIPAIIFWILIYFGDSFIEILTSRFFSGCVSGAIQSAIILYTSEIANDEIRGRLSSIYLFMRNVGILIAYILGATTEYRLIPIINLIIPIIFVILYFGLPNTPQYLLRMGQTLQAEKALKYYKGFKGESKQEESCFYKEFERLKLLACQRKVDENLHLSDFLNRGALKGLGVGFLLSSFSQFSGNFLMISYAVMIFDKAGASIDSHVSSIILSVALIVGSLFPTYLADRLGRKLLNMISLMGCAIGMFSMAIFYNLHLNGYDLSAFAWVPVMSLSFVIFISSAGITPLTYVCIVEYLPSKIRVAGMTILGVTINIVVFIILKLFPILLEIVDLHGCMIILGSGCVLGFFFVLLVMKETSGRSLDSVGSDE